MFPQISLQYLCLAKGKLFDERASFGEEANMKNMIITDVGILLSFGYGCDKFVTNI